jgi:N-methylhydantoinase A
LVESGPAAGAILTSRVALQCGVSRALSFDMGGTTAKICLIDDGEPQAARTFEVARAYRFLKGSGLPLRIPVIEMVEIGAGGGSIARVDALKRMTVGPDSAGAVPGPACYGRGGDQATVTDADLLLGRIEPTAFAAGIALDVQAAAMAVRNAGAALELDGPLAALAISETVDENMASAARVHAVERGKSLEERTLIAFGGAAPLHAARLAEKLGIQRIVVPAAAGVGSAVGMLDAPVAYEIARSLYQRVTTLDPDAVNLHLRAMRQEAHEVVARSAGNAPLAETCTAYMRFIGQGHEIAVPLEARPLESADREHLQRAFEREYRAQFGRAIPNLEAEVLSWAIAVRARVEAPARDSFGSGQSADVPCAIGERALCDPHSGHPVPAQVFRREALAPGARIDGPALVVEDETSVVVPAGFTAIATRFGHLVLERVATQPQEAQA